MEKKLHSIHDEFVTLGQLLKFETIVSSGGMAKWYLSEFPVKVNGESEQRRGKKLYHGDVITFINEELEITIQQVGQMDEN